MARKRNAGHPDRAPVRDPELLTDRGLRTRNALLVAARRVFETDGFLDARITDIAERAKVAHGTFYVYFDSKESILQEVVRQVHQELLLPMERNPEDALATVEGINRHYLTVYRRNARILVAWHKVASINPEFEALQRELRIAYAEWSAQGIRALQRSGLADSELDADLAAAALTLMLSQFAYSWFSEGIDYDFDTAVKQFTRLGSNAILLGRVEEKSRR